MPLAGKLRIYFGAAQACGTTHAMLEAALSLREAGLRVAAGCALRSEDAGLQQLQRRLLGLQKVEAELDLPALLAECPHIVVVDDLAGGQQTDPRWQQVQDLLAAGINVFTSLHARDLRSLQEVVAGVSGSMPVARACSVPDQVLDQAAEVVLVDLPVDLWLSRLQPRVALNSPLLRVGNLLALRELAARRVANHPGLQRLEVFADSTPGLLLCVGPRADATQLVQRAARLAAQMRVRWHALYVETPALAALPEAERERILQNLKLAESLGAHSVVISAVEVTSCLLAYARQQQIASIALGRSRPPWYRRWWYSRAARIAHLAPELNLIEIADDSREPPPGTGAEPGRSPHLRGGKRFAFAALASAATAVIALPLAPWLELANITMLFLLTVVLVSLRFGRAASVVATVVGVLSLMFALPLFAPVANKWQYSLTFGVMLVVGLLTAKLTTDLRHQVGVAAQREARARALYEFARSLSGVLQTEQIFEICRDAMQRSFHAQATLLLPDQNGHLQTLAPDLMPSGIRDLQFSALELGTAQWAFDQGRAAGVGTGMLPGSQYFYLPLVAPMRTRGILAIRAQTPSWDLMPEQRQQLDTCAALLAIALERVHYVEVAQQALVAMESERLRNSLLAALSHDVRTPLTSLVGLSEALSMSQPPLSAQQNELALALREEALRMSQLVANLLDMARIENGNIALKLEWQSLEEVVGSALRASQRHLQAHRVRISLAPDLPLVAFDAILIERVLCNLLENAAKYTPPGSHILLRGMLQDQMLRVQVEDDGPGIAAGQEEAIFEKFARGARESNLPGVGLGLSICRAIVHAHRGRIWVETPGRGACFVFTLPAGEAPALPVCDEEGMEHE